MCAPIRCPGLERSGRRARAPRPTSRRDQRGLPALPSRLNGAACGLEARDKSGRRPCDDRSDNAGQRSHAPAQSEGDSNLTDAAAPGDGRQDETTRSCWPATPPPSCIKPVHPLPQRIAKAEGIWIEDAAGRRYMDFHGNNVHHLGYGHPRLMAAIEGAARRAALRAAPLHLRAGRGAGREAGRAWRPAISTRCCSPPAARMRSRSRSSSRARRPGGSRRISFWDAFHGAGFGAASVGGEALFRSRPGRRRCSPGTEHVGAVRLLSLPLWLPGPDGKPELERCRMPAPTSSPMCWSSEQDVAAVIAEPARAVPYLPPPGFWAEVRAGLRPARRAADLRRDPDRARQDRAHVRLRA